MPKLPGMPELPPEMLQNAKQLGGVFDPSQLPDSMHMEFTIIDSRWQKETRDNGAVTARFVFFNPMLPFIKFSIPFDLDGLVNFHRNVTAAVEAMVPGMGAVNDITVSDTETELH